MNCSKCGTSLPDNAKFCLNCGATAAAVCTKCGAPLNGAAKFCIACGTPTAAAPTAPAAPAANVPDDDPPTMLLGSVPPVQPAAPAVPAQPAAPAAPVQSPMPERPSVQITQPVEQPKASNTKRNIIILVVVLVLLVAGAVTALFATGTIGGKDPEKILATAERYLDEKDYEQAIIQYKKLLEIDPMNVDAYLGLAEAYEGSGDEDEAAEILEKALDKLEDDDKAVRKLEKALDKLDKNSNKDMIRPNEAVGESSRPIDSADTSYSDYSTAEVFIPDADTDVAIPVMPDAPITTSNVATTTTTAVTVEDIKDVDAGGFTPSGNAGTVKFLGYYDITVDQKGIDQINIFESQQYNGKIEWISASSGSAYYEKLAMLIAADDSPDLMTYEPLAFPYGVSRNMFEPLDSYIDIDDALWDDMRDIIDSYEYNDKHYYIPHRITTKYALN
ncbi:MAG: extracellular solute-binding protein, partial [Ruminococcaceae bacterium]|nr:extracellular solute-binding protein [Oscillospiraceae bacterium]